MQIKSLYFLVFFIFVCVLNVFSQKLAKKNITNTPDTLLWEKRIKEMMDSARVTGVSVASIREGKVFWSRNFGLKNKCYQTRADTSTLFEAASLSKPMFSYIAMQLLERKVFELDKPLVQYVPEDTIARYFLGHRIFDNRFRKITARMCLSHSTGFPNGRWGNLTVGFEPGTDMNYSGEGIEYLQFVLEYLTNKKLNEWANELVFAPLDMPHSSYLWRDDYQNRLADSHGSLGGCVGFRRHSKASGSYTLVTSGEDYGKFLAAMVNLEGLKPENFNEMWKPQSTAKTGFLVPLSWGLGMGVFENNLGRAFWHWGDIGTAKAYFVCFPDKKLGMVMFANSANGLNMGANIAKLLTGGEQKPFDILTYEQYDSTTMLLYQPIAETGFESGFVVLNEINRKKRNISEYTFFSVSQKLAGFSKFLDAFKVLKLAVLMFPQSAEAHYRVAEEHFRLGNRWAAIGFWKKTMELNPKHAQARQRLVSFRAL